jgi:hypothetical protein
MTRQRRSPSTRFFELVEEYLDLVGGVRRFDAAYDALRVCADYFFDALIVREARRKFLGERFRFLFENFPIPICSALREVEEFKTILSVTEFDGFCIPILSDCGPTIRDSISELQRVSKSSSVFSIPDQKLALLVCDLISAARNYRQHGQIEIQDPAIDRTYLNLAFVIYEIADFIESTLGLPEK